MPLCVVLVDGLILTERQSRFYFTEFSEVVLLLLLSVCRFPAINLSVYKTLCDCCDIIHIDITETIIGPRYMLTVESVVH